MNKKTFSGLLSVLVICILCVFTVTYASATAADGDTWMQSNKNVIKNGTGEYTLSDNCAKFDGTVYEYNLDEFFSESGAEFYTYEITSEISADSGVVIDENILRIAPSGRLLTPIKISATDRQGDTFFVKLNLRYIDAAAYLTEKILSVTLKILIVFLIILLLTFVFVPFGGSIRIAHLNSGASTTKSRMFGVVEIPGNFPVQGRILAGWGKYIRFIPGTDVYLKGTESAVKVRAIRIDMGSKTDLYTDAELTNGISIQFFK